MKKPASNHTVPRLEEEFSAARAKAQASVSAAQAAKEKARAMKRRLKKVRQEFKQAKKAAKKLARLAHSAEEELKRWAKKMAKEKKRSLNVPRPATDNKGGSVAVATAARPSTGKPLRQRARLSTSNVAGPAAVQPQEAAKVVVPAVAAETAGPNQ